MSNTQLIIALFAIIMAAPAIGEIIRLACLAGHQAVSGHNLHGHRVTRGQCNES